MFPKKYLAGSEKRKKMKRRATKTTTRSSW